MSEPDGWLGLQQVDERRFRLELTNVLSRFDRKLYGGTGLAMATATLEAASGRAVLWTTVQFVGSADEGECIDCVVDALAEGRNVSQLQVTATVDDRVVFVALGSVGHPRDDGLDAELQRRPDLPSPDASEPWMPRTPTPIPETRRGWFDLVELRLLTGEVARAGQGSMWARLRDGRRHTRASLGFVADMVPSGVVRAAGRAGAGTSLDNSIRFGPPPDTEWVLIDVDPYFAASGYLHGAARLWSPEGMLLAVASQTAVTRLFD
jgi:acyl-CoA thioesterase